MEKIKNLIRKIEEKLSTINSISLIEFIVGMITTSILFGITSVSSHPSYGGAIISSIVIILVTPFFNAINLKRTMNVAFGSVVALMLILFAML